MKIFIECSLDNAAFEDNPEELAKVLDQIPGAVRLGDDGKLKDSNGITVGSWSVNPS